MNHRLDYCSETADIILKPLSYEDSQRFRLLRNQPDNRKWFIFSGEITEMQQKQWYDTYLLNANDFMFAVYNKSDEFIGAAALYHVDHARHTAELGRILLDATLGRGRGYGTQVINALCLIAKESLHLSTLYLSVYSDNTAAHKLYTRSDFILSNKYIDDRSGREMYKMEKKL